MTTTTAAAALIQGRRALRDGRGTEAASVARNGLAGFPDDGRFVQLMALAWHAEGRRRSARHAFETALYLAPLWPESQLALAEIYSETKRPRDAHLLLTALAERDDLDVQQLPRVAALFGRLGDHASALALCRRAIERDADCDEALFGAAYYMRRLNFAPEMVAAVLRRAVRLDPECCLYRRTLASLLASLGEIAEAYELYRTLVPHEVRCRGCLRTMIEIFERSGDEPRRAACTLQLDALDRHVAARSPVDAPSLESRE